jgi:hypothetical protein
MKPVAVYHWWSLPNEPPVYKNLRTPIIGSIASLRSVSDVSIVVLDISDVDTDWGHFPEKLKFEVIKYEPILRRYSHLLDGWRHLSRIPDLHKWAQSDVMYVDSDVFFFRDPFPLACSTEKFCWDGWNTGFFYFNPKAEMYQRFYSIFECHCLSAIHSENIRKLMKPHVGYDSWYGVWDEMLLAFIKNEHNELFNYLPVEEHTTARILKDCDNPKVFHANGSMVTNPLTQEKHARGLIPLIMEEFYQNIKEVLSVEDLRAMYGECFNYFEKQRVHLLQNTNHLDWCKDTDGLYLLNRLLKPLQYI